MIGLCFLGGVFPLSQTLQIPCLVLLHTKCDNNFFLLVYYSISINVTDKNKTGSASIVTRNIFAVHTPSEKCMMHEVKNSNKMLHGLILLTV